MRIGSARSRAPFKTMKPRHPLHPQDWVDMLEAQYPGGYNQNFYRRQGKSTAQALIAIATAIQNPYTKVNIRDHYGTINANEHQLRMIEGMIDKLGLEHIKLGKIDNQHFIQFGEIKE